MKNKLLLIVDPQYDFINGSLPVNGAAGAMNALAKYAAEYGGEYVRAAVTSDWHPWRHCSFDREGGPWPVHCLQHSKGAAIWQNLLEALYRLPQGFTLLTKGDSADREEYSILQNPASRGRLLTMLDGIDVTDVCGLAGDVCVLNTAKDLHEAGFKLNILEEFSPCIGDGKDLREFISSL